MNTTEKNSLTRLVYLLQDGGAPWICDGPTWKTTNKTEIFNDILTNRRTYIPLIKAWKEWDEYAADTKLLQLAKDKNITVNMSNSNWNLKLISQLNCNYYFDSGLLGDDGPYGDNLEVIIKDRDSNGELTNEFLLEKGANWFFKQFELWRTTLDMRNWPNGKLKSSKCRKINVPDYLFVFGDKDGVELLVDLFKDIGAW